MTPVLLAALVLLPSTPFGPADLVAWHGNLNSQCSDHHIDDWMPVRNQVDLIDQFETMLPSKIHANLVKAADAQRTCANAEGDEANSCEMIVDIHALKKLHLLGRFTAYACNQAICSEPAHCDRPPAPR